MVVLSWLALFRVALLCLFVLSVGWFIRFFLLVVCLVLVLFVCAFGLLDWFYVSGLVDTVALCDLVGAFGSFVLTDLVGLLVVFGV